MKISQNDKKLISLLEKNSRISLNNLSKKIGSSPQAVHYKINKLQTEKVISGFPTIIDYAFFGLIEIKVYFKILYTSSKILNEILKYFKDNRFVTEIIECGGNRDMIIDYQVKNISQFNKIIHEDKEKFQKHLQIDTILFSIVNHFPDHNILIGGDREAINFKKPIKKLLYLLAKNSKVTIVDLVKQLKLDPKTIIKAIRKLKNDKIIRAYTTNIDRTKLNKTLYKILIKYSNISTRKEKGFLGFIKKRKGVKLFTKVVGEFNVEFEVEIEKNIELRKLIFEIKERYSDIIQDINEIPIYYIHKRQYLPEIVSN